MHSPHAAEAACARESGYPLGLGVRKKGQSHENNDPARRPDARLAGVVAGRSGEERGGGEEQAESGQDGEEALLEAPPGRAPLPSAREQRRHHQMRRRVSLGARGSLSMPPSGRSAPTSIGT